MDHRAFDRLARLLVGETTRRAGLQAAFGGLLGIAAVTDAEARTDAGKGKGKGHDRPRPEGPCGDGSREANLCKKNKDCCTGICRAEPGLRNRDGKGRCRCQRPGQPCRKDVNCCKDVRCVDKRCAAAAKAIALAKPCTLADTCADAGAVCTEYASDTPAGDYCLLPNGLACTADNQCVGGSCNKGACDGKVPTGIACQQGDTCQDPLATCTGYKSGSPTGTYCLLKRGDACDAPADCVPGDCVDNVCVSCSCRGCDSTCVPVVCASGCDFATVQAAIDAAARGAIITIESGTYVEDLAISRDLTLRACPGQIATITNTAYGNRAITVTGSARLDLINIVIAGYNDSTNAAKRGGGIVTNGDIALCGNSALRNNYAEKGGGLHVVGPRTVRITDQTVIESNYSDSYGGGVYLDGRGNLLVNEVAVIRSNTTQNSMGGGFATTCGNVTLADNALIDKNVADSYGGNGSMVCWTGKESYRFVMQDDAVVSNCPVSALYLYGNIAGGCEIQVEMRDRAKITGNTAATDGGAIYMWEGTMRMSGDSEISGNSSTGAGGSLYIAPPISGSWITAAPQFVMEDNARFTGNSSTANSTNGGALYVYGLAMEMRDNAAISGNNAVYGGGVVFISNTGTPTSLTMYGTSKITANTASNSGGGTYWVQQGSGSMTLAINDAAGISGNTPDQCNGVNTSITC